MPQDGGAAAGGDLRHDRRDRRALRVRDLFAFFPVVLPGLRPIAGGVAAGAPDRGLKNSRPDERPGGFGCRYALVSSPRRRSGRLLPCSSTMVV